MEKRRIISYVFFTAGILLALAGLLGVAAIQGVRGILLGLAAVIVGIIFYRRGK
jgi:hypothetical protein